MEIALLIGEYVGVVTIFLAFWALQKGYVAPKAPKYLLANIVGGALLLVVAAFLSRWGWVALNGLWICVAFQSLLEVKTHVAEH